MNLREVPRSKPITAWYGAGRWFHRRSDAYYAIAKQLVTLKYPRWLQDNDLDEVEPAVSDVTSTIRGDLLASCEQTPMRDWKLRRAKLKHLFYRRYSGSYEEPSGEHFDSEKWRVFVRRVARFLAFTDSRRSA